MQVYSWFLDTGNPFLSAANAVGVSEQDAIALMKKHTGMEVSTEDSYALAERLQAKAKELAGSSECDPALIGKEAESLQSAEGVFKSRMGERREILEKAAELFRKIEEVCMYTSKTVFMYTL